MFSGIKVQEIMAKDAITVSPDENISSAAQLMMDNDIRSLIVVDRKEVIGIITDEDIVRRAVAQKKSHKTLVGDVMTPTIITASPDEDLVTVSMKMNKADISSVPIVDKSRALIGIITRTDMMKVYPKLAEYLQEHSFKPEPKET